MSVTKNHQRKIQKYQLLDSSKSPQNVLTVNIILALMPGMWPLSWLLSIEAALRHPDQWCIAKNEGGCMQTGVAKGLKVPCLFMIAEVSICCQKTRRLVYGIYSRIPPNTPLILSSHCHLHWPTVLDWLQEKLTVRQLLVTFPWWILNDLTC